MIPQDLIERYNMVREQFVARFPHSPVPELPLDNPNEAVNVIDLMLGPLQGRQPTRITEGQPMLFQDTTPEYPGHPAEKEHRAPFPADPDKLH